MRTRYAGLRDAEVVTASPEIESLAERYARSLERRLGAARVDAALRTLDVLISATVLLIASPILVLVTIVYLATSGTPLFYRGLRVGRHGRIFHMSKFRTLGRDAQSRLGPTTARNSRPGRPPRWRGSAAGFEPPSATRCRSSGRSSAATCPSSDRA